MLIWRNTVPKFDQHFDIFRYTCLRRMKKLRHLDVSQWNDSTPSHVGTFSNPSVILARLIDSLPELKSLDLSGTNLPSQSTDASQEDSALLKCFYTKHDIKTLKVRRVRISRKNVVCALSHPSCPFVLPLRPDSSPHSSSWFSILLSVLLFPNLRHASLSHPPFHQSTIYS